MTSITTNRLPAKNRPSDLRCSLAVPGRAARRTDRLAPTGWPQFGAANVVLTSCGFATFCVSYRNDVTIQHRPRCASGQFPARLRLQPFWLRCRSSTKSSQSCGQGGVRLLRKPSRSGGAKRLSSRKRPVPRRVMPVHRDFATNPVAAMVPDPRHQVSGRTFPPEARGGSCGWAAVFAETRPIDDRCLARMLPLTHGLLTTALPSCYLTPP